MRSPSCNSHRRSSSSQVPVKRVCTSLFRSMTPSNGNPISQRPVRYSGGNQRLAVRKGRELRTNISNHYPRRLCIIVSTKTSNSTSSDTVRKILITGGAGFIGSHVVRRFVTRYPSYTIVNLDKLTYAGNLENLRDVEGLPNYHFEKGDILNVRFLT